MTSVAHADAPCDDALTDPIDTPLRDGSIDGHRAACGRDEAWTQLAPHALIDTPGFHGVLGATLAVGLRHLVTDHLELSGGLRILDGVFVQNAVNKVTTATAGPLLVGALWTTPLDRTASLGVLAVAELPATRVPDTLDTIHLGGQLAAIVTGQLAPRWRLHARLGGIAAHASSSGGTTTRVALRGGIDLAWLARARLAWQLGADLQAGWVSGLDHVLVRAGLTWRPGGGAWRLRTGVAVPLGGTERTTAVLDLALVRDL
jgi:hypothetical protein